MTTDRDDEQLDIAYLVEEDTEDAIDRLEKLENIKGLKKRLRREIVAMSEGDAQRLQEVLELWLLQD